MKPIKIAIFSSGSGSNAARIIEAFKNHEKIAVQVVISNKSDAQVLERAKLASIQTVVFDNSTFDLGDKIVAFLTQQEIDWIILAGFLRKIADPILTAFPNKIINIHPSLLPKFGGKGMYGMYVHKAVIAANETESGITIHLVNEVFDNGKQLAQHRVPILENETADSLAVKIQALEHEFFAKEIEKTIFGL